jgi:hypothetical protein
VRRLAVHAQQRGRDRRVGEGGGPARGVRAARVLVEPRPQDEDEEEVQERGEGDLGTRPAFLQVPGPRNMVRPDRAA